MNILPILLLGAFWAILYLLRNGLKERLCGDGEGEEFVVQLGYMRWQTTTFNRLLGYIGRRFARSLDVWFKLGVAFGVLAMVAAVVILLGNAGRFLAPVAKAPTAALERSSATLETKDRLAVPAMPVPEAGISGVQENADIELRRPVPSPPPSPLAREVVTLPPAPPPDAEADADAAGEEASRSGESESASPKRSSVPLPAPVTRTGASTLDPSALAMIPVLTPLLPGVNVPWPHTFYFILALLFSGIFHEIGHAIAAASEKVKINSVGVVFMLAYPGGFVNMNDHDLQARPPGVQLKIFCAGVWHNAVLAVFAWLLILTLPVLLSPFYASAGGMEIVHVAPDSPMYGHLAAGDVITSANGCATGSYQEWEDCLVKAHTQPFPGLCLPATYIDTPFDVSCCDADKLDRSALQCFQSIHPVPTNTCLSSRQLSAREFCAEGGVCAAGTERCVVPVLGGSERLLRLERQSRRSAHMDVFYLGYVSQLMHTVEVSPYVPRFALMEYLPRDLPRMLERLLRYTIAFSAAMACLNVAPVYHLDGQWALVAALDLFAAHWAKETREKVARAMLTTGSLLLLLNLVVCTLSVLW